MRILVSGDSHGDYYHIVNCCVWANDLDCDLIVQVGDFGYIWTKGIHDPMESLVAVNEILTEYDQKLFFLDGNHEDFTAISDITGVDFKTGENTSKPINVFDRITYLPRASRWEWDGVSFLAVGGAISIDRRSRTRYVTYWPEEATTDGDVERSLAGSPVDVVFAHDAPFNTQVLNEHLIHNGWNLSNNLQRDCDHNRILMSEIRIGLNPKLWVHGHYHFAYTDKVSDTKIIGLDCNGRGRRAITVLDTKDMR